MPIVLKTVIVIDLTDHQAPPAHATRCDGCSRPLGDDSTSAVVRNRYGPASVRQVHLCPECRDTLALQAQGEEDAPPISRPRQP